MRIAYNKLVRDQIPDIIAAAGSQPSTRVLDHASYRGALRSKLLEEAQEAEEAPDEQLASELADVLEVLRALAMSHGMTWEDAGVAALTCMCSRAKGLFGNAYRRFLFPGGCG